MVALGLYLAAFGVRLARSARSWNGPVAFYEAIIAESPEASHGYGGLGRILVDQGKYGPGVEALEIAAALGPRDSRHLNNLGQACLRAGRIKRAREVAELGRQRFPGQAKFDRLLSLTRPPISP
jgi:tetratricopeptide (TPR) repeat protein